MQMKSAKSISARIWAIANDLRSTMDANEYKNYILPFIFYRYLSERQDRYLKENSLEDFYNLPTKSKGDFSKKENDALEEYIADIVVGLGYAIKPRYLWVNMVDRIIKGTFIASDFQDLFDDFNKNIKRNESSYNDFKDIFADVNIGDTRLGKNTNERAQALFKMIEAINEMEFKDENGKDILGDVYEFLIGEFASSAGKKGGEFYTPHEVSKILARIVTLGVKDTGEQFRVYDPTMGSGSLLLTVQKELEFGDKKGAVNFYGQEKNTTTYNLARMNLMMHEVSYMNMTLRCGDTLLEDWPFEKDGNIESPLIFDAVVANPPYSQKWGANSTKDPRFKAGLAPKSRADYAFVQHSLYHLSRTGTMAIVLPHGVLFRGGSEAKIRKELIKSNKLDAVIGLPANLFYGTGIPTCVLVYKGVDAKESRDVLFIDASKSFEKAKNKNKLTDKHIEDIIKAYETRENVDKFAYLATHKEIEENDYNLNIPRYVDTFEEEPVIPLAEVLQEMKSTQEEINRANKSLISMLSELGSEDTKHTKELEDLLNWLKEQ